MKATHSRYAIAFVCGAPGSGKSFTMTRDVIDRLISDPNVIISTNLPLNVAQVAAYVASKSGAEVDAVLRRIDLLDRDMLKRWASGNGGPWELAAQGKANGYELLLDECHVYCSKRHKTRHQQWETWLGEARHESWRRIVFITQDESKVGPPIKDHSELRFELTNSELRRDPFLQIPLAYWYELIASFTGEYRSSIALTEYRRVNSRLKEQHTDKYPLDPFWFQFYNSYEAAGGGTGKGQHGTALVREFTKRPRFLPTRKDGRFWLPTWMWFIRLFAFRFGMAVSALLAVIWLVPFGGATVLLNTWIASLVFASSGKPPVTSSDDPAIAAETATEETSTEPTMTLREVLSELPEEWRQVVIGEMREDAREVQRAQAEVKAIQAQRDTERRRHTVVALTKDQVWFTDPPCTCQVGKTMSEGPYVGKTVKQINVDDGWVSLDGGITLWVGRSYPGRMPESDAEDAGHAKPPAGNNGGGVSGSARVLPGPLQTPPAGGPTPELAEPRNGANNDLGGRDEPSGLREESSLRSVLVRRDGGKPRQQNPDPRNPRPTDRRGPGSRRTALQRRVTARGEATLRWRCQAVR